jgi:hypothetical protein
MIRERVLGAEHLHTLSTRHVRAIIFEALRRFAEALQKIEALLPIQERVFGKEYPHTFATRHVRAHVLNMIGRCEDALQDIDEVLPMQERVIGHGHPTRSPRDSCAHGHSLRLIAPKRHYRRSRHCCRSKSA